MLKIIKNVLIIASLSAITAVADNGYHTNHYPVFKGISNTAKKNIVQNLPNLAFPTIYDQAKLFHLSIGGGILKGYVFIVPQRKYWYDALYTYSRKNTFQLFLRPFRQGDTVEKAYNNFELGSELSKEGVLPIMRLSQSIDPEACYIVYDELHTPVVIRNNEIGINRYVFRHYLNNNAMPEETESFYQAFQAMPFTDKRTYCKLKRPKGMAFRFGSLSLR